MAIVLRTLRAPTIIFKMRFKFYTSHMGVRDIKISLLSKNYKEKKNIHHLRLLTTDIRSVEDCISSQGTLRELKGS